MTGMVMTGAATETEVTNVATLAAVSQNATAHAIESAMDIRSGNETESARRALVLRVGQHPPADATPRVVHALHRNLKTRPRTRQNPTSTPLAYSLLRRRPSSTETVLAPCSNTTSHLKRVNRRLAGGCMYSRGRSK